MDQQLIIGGALIAACVGAVGVMLLAPTRNAQAAKRAAAVTGGGKRARGGAVQDHSKDRRRHVQESLKAIEAKAKQKKPKLTLQKTLEQSGLTLTVRDFYVMSAISAVFGGVIGLITGQSLLVDGLLFVAFGLGMPRWAVGMLRTRRQKKFLMEFSGALDIIVRGVKSGLPVNDCMRIIAQEGRPPVSEEFHLVIEGIRLGLSMEQALMRMADRMPLQETSFFAIVLVIQQKTGGNLAEALGNLSKVIRARKLMEGKIKALSAEAQASALIIGSLPFLVMGMVKVMSPDYLDPLFTKDLGHLILMVAGSWMAMGIFVMKKMIAIKV